MPTLNYILLIARYTVAVLFGLACLIALAQWAVRQRKLNAFGPIARFTRKISDPVLKPVERRVVGMGGNPQDAPIWLIGLVVAAGLVFLALLQWIVGVASHVILLSHGGPRDWISFAVSLAYFVVTTALFFRVIGSWFGIGRYNRWMRVAYRLTDWIVEPIRRVLPAFGFLDVSPLVAWLVLWLVRQALLRLFLI